MNLQLRNIVLLICVVFFYTSCNNIPNEPAGVDQNINVDNNVLSEAELQHKIFVEGDTLAFFELFNRKFKTDLEEMVFWSQILAYKFNSSLGYLYIYAITTQIYLNHGMSFHEIDSTSKNNLLNCLKISASLGNTNAINVINENHPTIYEK